VPSTPDNGNAMPNDHLSYQLTYTTWRL